MTPSYARGQQASFSARTGTPPLPQRELSAGELLDWTLAADPSQVRSVRPVRVATTLARLIDARPSVASSELVPVSKIRGSAERTASESLATARRLFKQLHTEVLTGEFEPGCGRLDRTLAHGHYNCLTATILYLAACRQAGIPAQALAAPGHVCVLLRLADAAWVVELTQPVWNATHYRPPHRDLRVVADRALLARVYYNLAIEDAAALRLESGLTAARIACELDPDDKRAKDNLLAILNNRCLELLQKESLVEAQALVQAGLRLDPQHASLRRCEIYLQEFDTYPNPE